MGGGCKVMVKKLWEKHSYIIIAMAMFEAMLVKWLFNL
jgi:hypothetical protein